MSFYSNVITGMTTGNNNLFVRFWTEIDITKAAIGETDFDNIDIRKQYWIPYSKGGERRNWYGNTNYLVNWKRKDEFNRSKTTLQHFYLREAVTWPFINTDTFSARYLPVGYLWDVAGSPCFFESDRMLKYCLGFLCSKVAATMLSVINPTINVQAIDIEKLPIIINDKIMDDIISIVEQCIIISKSEWDSYELSWDFLRHPLANGGLIEEEFVKWRLKCESWFDLIKANEEEINRLFIETYRVERDINSIVDERRITIRHAELTKDIKNLISYSVGCMFGRYSFDEEGLIYAGGEWDISRYTTFIPDEDNCIPITDEEYFSDDIVGRFVEFVKTVYGAETLEENLDFIARALGNKGDTSREVIRNYFLKDFYADHLKVYQKRPIYWLFDSGKENGFKALIYMHRYDADTVGRVRTDYLHRAQKYVETAMQSAQYTIDNATSNSEKSKATKAVTKYTKQLAEMKIYDEAIAHIANKRIEIDLDDGVKVNYEKFQGVEVAQEGKKSLKVDLLAKIK